MTTRKGHDPFKTPPPPAFKTTTAPPASGSPEDLLFAEEADAAGPSERTSPEPWGGATACMEAPATAAADLADQGELDLLAGLVGSAAATTQPAPVRAAVTVPAAPRAEPAAAQPGQGAARAVLPGVLPALPPTPRSRMPSPALVLLPLAAGVALGAGFALAGNLLLAACALGVGCGAAAALWTRCRRVR